MAGCHIEDQVDEKRCGHLDNKEVISKEDMVKKIKIAVKARKDNNFLIIVRTDSNTVEGLDKTIERVKTSGEMIYNKKEQLTSDLGAKEK